MVRDMPEQRPKSKTPIFEMSYDSQTLIRQRPQGSPRLEWVESKTETLNSKRRLGKKSNKFWSWRYKGIIPLYIKRTTIADMYPTGIGKTAQRSASLYLIG